MNDGTCAACHGPALGEAYIDGQRYCHGPWLSGYVTCYTAAVDTLPPGVHDLWALETDPEVGEAIPVERRVTV